MTDRVRYGVLSTSQIARRQHVPAARESANSEIAAISSRDKTRAGEWAQKLGIPKAYGSYDELIADPDIDAVINPLPNSLHAEWTIKSAEAGKHILCEKPLAVTVEGAQRMIDAAEANGVLLMEGFTTQFQPMMPFIRETIDSGEIGEVMIARAELTYTIQDWGGDNRVKRELGGGALLDAGCYCVNAVRFLMDREPESVQAFQRVRESHGVDSTFVGLLRFADDRMAYIATGMEQPFRACCEVIGTEGRIEVPYLFGGQVVKVVVGREEREERFEQVNRFRVQMEHFAECILRGQAPMLPPEDGLNNTKVLVALQRAAREGREVPVQIVVQSNNLERIQ